MLSLMGLCRCVILLLMKRFILIIPEFLTILLQHDLTSEG